MQNNTLNKLNALVDCNPAYCKHEGCPLYYIEEKKCDADRFINMFISMTQNKLENIKQYSIFDKK